MKPLIDCNEHWADVVGYEGLYKVSTAGNVYSLERTHLMTGRHESPYLRKVKARMLKPYYGRYASVGLHKDGVVTRVLVHRLVAESFIPNPEGKLEVNHIDENPHNNTRENLEWVTRSENATHSKLKFSGSKSGTAKLSEFDVLDIVDDLKHGYSQTEIAVNYGVTNHTIHKIKCGKNWGWLTGLDKEGNLHAVTN